MLHNEPDILSLLRKIQESSTEDVDEERGSFKEGDRVIYEMFGSSLTNSDLIKMLGVNEHASRLNHNGSTAKVVEAIGEEVSRYSIVFDDGFAINDVAASELKVVNEGEWPEDTVVKGILRAAGFTEDDFHINIGGEVVPYDEDKAPGMVKALNASPRLPFGREAYYDEKDNRVVLVKKESSESKTNEDVKSDLVDICRSREGWAVAEQLKKILENPTVDGIEDAELNHNAIRLIYRFLKRRSEEEATEAAEAIEDWVEADYGDPDIIKSKTNEQKLSVDDVKKLFKSIDKAFAKHLTGLTNSKKEVIKRGQDVGLELSDEGKKVLEETKTTNEAEDATQTMKPQEKPDINAEDFHMEDYSGEDLNKPEAKVKSKSAETGDAIRQVEDDELEQKPDKVVEPKKEAKESKLTVPEQHQKKIAIQTLKMPDAMVGVMGGMNKEEARAFLKKIGWSDEKIAALEESKLQEEETEITPSRVGLKKFSDEKLKELYHNSLRSYNYWKKAKEPEKATLAAGAIEKYEDEMVAREMISDAERSEDIYSRVKKESKFSLAKKEKPFWLCNECCTTFRSIEGICENCKSKNVERITSEFRRDIKVGDRVGIKDQPDLGLGTVQGVDLTSGKAKVEWDSGDRTREDLENLTKRTVKRSVYSEKVETNEEKGEVSFLKNIYIVKFKLDGAEKETRVMDFSDAEAKKHVLKLYPGAEILSVEKIKESKLSEQVEDLTINGKNIMVHGRSMDLEGLGVEEITSFMETEPVYLITLHATSYPAVLLSNGFNEQEAVENVIDPDDFEDVLSVEKVHAILEEESKEKLQEMFYYHVAKADDDKWEVVMSSLPALASGGGQVIRDDLTSKDEAVKLANKLKDDRDKVVVYESKLHETVQELVGEVPGIDRIDQGLLNKAIEKGVIPNQFPELEVMIDELSTAGVAEELGVKDIDDVDLGDIDAVYLKYILLPKAKKELKVAKESRVDEAAKEFDVQDFIDRFIEWETDRVGEDKSIEYEVVKEDLSDWAIEELLPRIVSRLEKEEIVLESKLQEQEDWDLTFQYAHDLLWHNPLRDKEGNPFIWAKHPITGKRIRVFTDHQEKWVIRNVGIPVRAKVEEADVYEAKEFEPQTVVEIKRDKVDPDVFNIRVVELPEGSITVLDTKPDKKSAEERGIEIASSLNAKFIGFVDEKKSAVSERRWRIRFTNIDGEEDHTTITAPSEEAAEEKFMTYDPECDIKSVIEVEESKLREQEEVSAQEIFDEHIKMGYDERKAAEATLDIMTGGAFAAAESDSRERMISKALANWGSKKEESLEEQEKNAFKSIAKGIEDKADADKLAREKGGQVIADEEDKGKFAVIIKEE